MPGLPGIAIGIPFRRGGGASWDAFWKSQPEVLFFGLYSEISGGQMPNKVTGATDFLTVAGVAGSETYQAPDTAPYQIADTDYIWFKTDVSQRTTTTAELIGYDFTRTIIKYANTSPYVIEAIMILSSDVDTAKMRDDFDLSVWWNDTLSAHGNLKGNRSSGKSVWTAESVVPEMLYTNTGGQGDRRAIIDITNTILFQTPISAIIDGASVNTTYFQPSAQDVAEKYIRFDFKTGNSKYISEARWYQDLTTSHGTWKWQGSNDASTWVDIGNSFTLGGGTNNYHTELNGNVTGYRYYQLIGVSGINSNACYIREIEFKIG